ncbi:MAG TPA: 2-oxoglutarate dehydrogenase E1 component, partial [Chloroflexota bacterium]|nr:2-oxoglutarate dehydrogenase E1 component [Chloroflexota bacterium]
AHEGQGPDHASARPERFLQLAADINMRIVNCTTAAQYFHLLRRQARLLRDLPRPLVVMTPKSLLRHPLSLSPPADFAEGTSFRAVLDDPFFARADRAGVRRVVLCSGKVYVDLATSEARKSASAVALVRVEQLYRFPAEAIERVLASYSNAQDVVWLQEEPQNMGAWAFVAPRLGALLNGRGIRYVGRPERASPSEGTPAWHAAEQARIVAEAFEGLTHAATVAVAAQKDKHHE